ncbi:LysR family transcriptional regulator [Staphylococcus piscifermentans]|uniref:LysR family transcriptional regulator n=1 Tax=Staphylococcus piscifermentans TaxID=70258 RepID=A0A239U5G8_9STAP|nr:MULTISPECIES: LysR family transcriptional regulator [Staphylococcus]AYU55101.1 LysR family transcriptional regulator [Staphylococcus debuckii]RTX82357.1 LysR family transcriptional regulator [Staphylococcus piscifermentans]GEP84293.1 LysR family transcriptional regulator [Staphylococcus piscifermentans]SNV05200.1 LysR family transcriptional regulator [Staphylococcus piscifermentans]
MDPFKVLIEVVKARSFTKAAENLYTSQPSISRDIKKLETEYDVKIFEFKHSRMTLTSDGEKLFSYALKQKHLEDTLRRELQQAPHSISGELTIGSSYTYGEYRLAQKLGELAQSYPKLHIHVHLDNSDHVIENVQRNIIDLGIVEKEIQANMIESTRIEKDEMVLIHKKAGGSNMDTCFVREKGSGTRFYQEEGLAQFQLHPFLVEINNTTLIKNMVHDGYGFSIVSKKTLTPFDKEKLEIIPLDIERYFYLLTHTNKYIDKNMEILINKFTEE